MNAKVTQASRSPALVGITAVAGIAFSLSWIVGLSVWSSSTDVSLSGEKLIRMYSGHETIALVQFFFTEGLPAIGLSLVLAGLGKYALRAGERFLGRTLLIFGLSAAALSLMQFGLGAYLCGIAVPGNRAEAVKSATDTLGRIDGLKMLCISAFSLAGFRLVRRGKARLPGWLAWASLALSATILVSAIGYLFLLDSLALAAYVSLPLLLLWMTSMGLSLKPSPAPTGI
jgi:hypothetical protein